MSLTGTCEHVKLALFFLFSSPKTLVFTFYTSAQLTYRLFDSHQLDFGIKKIANNKLVYSNFHYRPNCPLSMFLSMRWMVFSTAIILAYSRISAPLISRPYFYVFARIRVSLLFIWYFMLLNNVSVFDLIQFHATKTGVHVWCSLKLLCLNTCNCGKNFFLRTHNFLLTHSQQCFDFSATTTQLIALLLARTSFHGLKIGRTIGG